MKRIVIFCALFVMALSFTAQPLFAQSKKSKSKSPKLALSEKEMEPAKESAKNLVKSNYGRISEVVSTQPIDTALLKDDNYNYVRVKVKVTIKFTKSYAELEESMTTMDQVNQLQQYKSMFDKWKAGDTFVLNVIVDMKKRLTAKEWEIDGTFI